MSENEIQRLRSSLAAAGYDVRKMTAPPPPKPVDEKPKYEKLDQETENLMRFPLFARSEDEYESALEALRMRIRELVSGASQKGDRPNV